MTYSLFCLTNKHFNSTQLYSSIKLKIENWFQCSWNGWGNNFTTFWAFLVNRRKEIGFATDLSYSFSIMLYLVWRHFGATCKGFDDLENPSNDNSTLVCDMWIFCKLNKFYWLLYIFRDLKWFTNNLWYYLRSQSSFLIPSETKRNISS